MTTTNGYPNRQHKHLIDFVRTAHQLFEIGQQTALYERVLEVLNDNRAEVRFLQIGANDGRTNDPLFRFVQTTKWSGVMVEPHPISFNKLQTLYSDRPDIRLEQAAVTSTSGIISLYEPQSGEPGSSKHAGSATVVADSSWISRSAKPPKTTCVRGITMNELLARHFFYHIDVQQMDVEGYDFDNLRMFPFDRYKPIIVGYEDRHLFPPIKRREALRLLTRQGYQVCPALPPQDPFAVDLTQLCKT